MEAVQQTIITEEQIVTPVEQVFETITPGKEPLTTKNIPKSLTQSLDELFPEQRYDEKDIHKAKEILGELANEFTTEQLQDTISEIQYLAESWIDDFERKIFKGRTLNELLHEKGGV